MFPSKHHKDDKDKGKDKDYKKPSGRKNSFFSVADKSGLAFVRKKTKDGKDYEITVEKTKPKSRKSSNSHHDRDALPDIGTLRIEDDPDRYARHSRDGDPYGSYGSHEYLVRNPQSPGRVSGSGSSRRYTNTQYPDPEDGDVFYSDEDEESEVPYQDRRSHRGSSSYATQPKSYRYSRYTGPGGSVGTETLYESRRGDFGHGDGHRDRDVYGDGSVASRDSISQRSSRSQASHISGSSQRTIRPGDGPRHRPVQEYYDDYDSDEDYPPPSRQSSRYTGDSSRYTDDTSRYPYASGQGSHQQPSPPGSSSRHGSHRAPSSRHSQTTAPDSPYRASPHAEVIEAEDRASLASRGTDRTANEVPAPRGPSGSRHRAPATGFRAPSSQSQSQSQSRRESAYASSTERFAGPDPFQFQVPSSYTTDARSGTGTRTMGTTNTSRSTTSRGTGASSEYPPTARIFHYYEEGDESIASNISTSSRGTANRSRTGTSIPSDSDSDDTVTAYHREGRRGSSHTGSGSRHHHRRDSRGQDGGGGRGGSWIGSSQDGFSTFG